MIQNVSTLSSNLQKILGFVASIVVVADMNEVTDKTAYDTYFTENDKQQYNWTDLKPACEQFRKDLAFEGTRNIYDAVKLEIIKQQKGE